MTISMYSASVPVLKRALTALAHVLRKGAADAEARKIDPSVFLTARLAPNMFALTRQVQIASDAAKGCAARLAGVEAPKFEDTEASFDELQARIAKTIDFLDSVSAEAIDGSEERVISFKAGPAELNFSGHDYLLTWVFPNFYFHITTAYDILRHNGVDVGKRDFLGMA